MSVQLRIWTSPRDTTLWAADAVEAAAVRAALEAGGASWWPVFIRGVQRDNAVNIDIGYDAYQALTVLAGAGYIFAWHSSVEQVNRRPGRLPVKVLDLGDLPTPPPA